MMSLQEKLLMKFTSGDRNAFFDLQSYLVNKISINRVLLNPVCNYIVG